MVFYQHSYDLSVLTNESGTIVSFQNFYKIFFFLEALRRFNNSSYDFHLTEIMQLLKTLKSSGKQMKFQWISAHCGNEKADTIAKQVSQMAYTYRPRFPLSSCKPRVEAILKQ